MVDDRLRVLVIDDAPLFYRTDTGLISFSAGSGDGDDEIFSRNFNLKWIYDLGQAKEYAARVRVALRDNPCQLLAEAGYPNIFMFDYSMQKARLKARELRTLGSRERYEDELSPLKGCWGTRFELLGHGPDISKQFEWQPLPGDNQHGGCIAGVDITTLLDPYIHVGLPQTIHRDPVATAALEWHLSPNLGMLFRDKSGVLPHWYAFFHNALEELRRKLIVSSSVGMLTPRISDVLALCEPDGVDLAVKRVRFRSPLGEEVLRVEALFLDKLFTQDDGQQRMIPSDRAAAEGFISSWAQSLLEGAVGPWSQSDISEGLMTAARFIAAHADPLHHSRRRLSRSLHDAPREIADQVVEDFKDILGELGINAALAKQSLKAGRGKDLKLAADVAARCGVLGNLKTEAASELAGRFAAIAMIIWGEMAWKACVASDLDGWIISVEDVLSGNGAIEWELRNRLSKLSGVVVRDQVVQAVLDNPDDAAARERLSEALHNNGAIFASLQALTDFMNRNDIWKTRKRAKGDIAHLRASDDRGAKSAFIRYIFAPAPEQLFFWEESRADVDKQLARIGISIPAIINGETNNGLKPGEGVLIRLFAAEFGFDRRHWPTWMEDACK